MKPQLIHRHRPSRRHLSLDHRRNKQFTRPYPKWLLKNIHPMSLPRFTKPNFTLLSTNHLYLHHYTLHQRHLSDHYSDPITTRHQNHFSSDTHATLQILVHPKDPIPEQEDRALSTTFGTPIAQEHTKDKPVEI